VVKAEEVKPENKSPIPPLPLTKFLVRFETVLTLLANCKTPLRVLVIF